MYDWVAIYAYLFINLAYLVFNMYLQNMLHISHKPYITPAGETGSPANFGMIFSGLGRLCVAN